MDPRRIAPLKRNALAATVALVAGLGAVVWLKSAHRPAEAIEVAESFLAHIEARQFPQAYALTLQRGPVGATLPAFEVTSLRETCGPVRLVSTSPYQSKGNRLRRGLSGATVEMPEVRVEFEGACLLGVTVSHTEDYGWRVAKFARHAG
ncbi:hypothetical protein [Chitinimonas naiadis]